MELRQLRHFVAVAEDGNISRAAKRIFLTQPALSRQIKALEDEIGQCLLERQAHSIRLTRAGEALLIEARQLLQHADQLLERVRSAGKGVRLRVGYAPSLASGILSTTLETFTRNHPDAQVELYDHSTSEMLTGLEDGSLDVALGTGQLREARGLSWTPLFQIPWQLAVGRKHRLADQTLITPADVASERLLLFCRRGYPEYWELVSNWFRIHQKSPRCAGEYDGVDSLMAAVESGLGIAMVTMRTPHRIPEHVRLLPISSPPEPLCVALGCRTDRSKEQQLAEFLNQLLKTARTIT